MKKGQFYEFKDVDIFTSANIPLTKWLDDSTLELAHGIGLEKNKYFEFKWERKTGKIIEYKDITTLIHKSINLKYVDELNTDVNTSVDKCSPSHLPNQESEETINES